MQVVSALLLPFRTDSEGLNRVFETDFTLPAATKQTHWQVISVVVLSLFCFIALCFLYFIDDINFNSKTWLQRRSGHLSSYLLVAAVIMKTSHLYGRDTTDYRLQILINFILKLSCIVILMHHRPIFHRRERLVCLSIAIFNLWIAGSQTLRLVCIYSC
jgi:hypothetical protein